MSTPYQFDTGVRSVLRDPEALRYSIPDAIAHDPLARVDKVLFYFVLPLVASIVTNIYDKATGTTGGPLGMMSYAAIAGVIVYSWWTRPLQQARTLLMAWPMALVMALCFASIAWSDLPAFTFNQSVLLLLTFLPAIWAATRVSWRTLLQGYFFLAFAVTLLSTAFAVALPGLGVMPEGWWNGIFVHKQVLGMSMINALTATTAAWILLPKLRPWCLVGLPFMLLNLVMADSTTALLVGVLCAGIAVAVWVARLHPALAIVSVWAIAGAVLVGAVALPIAQEYFFDAIGKEATLTGRTDIWAGIQAVMQDRPLLGYGYEGLWANESLTAPIERIVNDYTGGWYRPPNAHSTWMEMWLAFGPIGPMLLAAVFAFIAVQLARLMFRSPAAIWVVPFMASIFIISFTETLVITSLNQNTLLFNIIFAKLALGDHVFDPKPAPARPVAGRRETLRPDAEFVLMGDERTFRRF